MAKPSLPQGTRDFNAETVRKRNYIFDTIRTVFELYGFQPLETPAMENLETLIGKYGDEGDKLIYRILDSGNPFDINFFEALWDYLEDFENKVQKAQEINGQEIKGYLKNLNILQGRIAVALLAQDLNEPKMREKYLSKFKNQVSEKALRYDLTIPFARYVAMNFGQLTFPFKRYQIQPVWRADRPQRGRYREFYQCDADVVGSNSLLNEVELANIYVTVFEKLGIDVEIKINSRKIFAALAEICQFDKMMELSIAIDKLEKIGLQKVKEELLQRGMHSLQVITIERYLNIRGSNEEKINTAKKLFGENETAKKGIEELEYVLNYQPELTSYNSRLTIDFTLARGLNYYTGIILEVKAKNVQMGSIGGGGRYDDLTGLFGVKDIPGVGISFGVDRIYDVMEELKLFPEQLQTGTQILFFNLGENESKAAFNLMQTLRNNNIKCELFHEQSKFDKQFKYAEKKNIPFIAILGSTELEENTCTIKNLKTGEQKTISQSELKDFEPLRH
jgi:histidyl-tRNA synthetase